VISDLVGHEIADLLFENRKKKRYITTGFSLADNF